MLLKSNFSNTHTFKLISLFIYLLLWCNMSFAQEQFKVDSLLAKYNSTESIDEKVKHLISISQLYDLNDIKKSFDYANQALIEAEKSDNYLPLAHAKGNLAVVFMRTGGYSKAVELLLESRTLLLDNNDDLRVVGIELNLGAVKFHLEDYDGALESFTKALELNEKLLAQGNDVYMNQIQIFYINIGSIYLEKEKYEAATEYMQKAIAESHKNNDLINEGIATSNIGDIYLRKGEYPQAKEYIEKSLVIREEAGDRIGIVSTNNLLTQYYMAVGMLDSAKEINQEAIILAEDLEASGHLERAYKYRAEILELSGDFEKSVNALKTYYSVKDSVLNESVIVKTTRLQLEHEFNELQKSKEEEHFKQMVRVYAALAVAVFLLILFVLLYYLHRNRAKRVKVEKDSLEKDLELRNRELTTNVMYLLKKHELISNVSARLLKLKSKLNIENKEAIQKIIFDLQGGAEPEVWEEFEVRFQNVHTDFYKRLQEVAPDLTPSELKICAFLKLNMNSKEISALIHQSTKSVEVKRSRIRKKLGLTNTDTNLIKFLTEL